MSEFRYSLLHLLTLTVWIVKSGPKVPRYRFLVRELSGRGASTRLSQRRIQCNAVKPVPRISELKALQNICIMVAGAFC